MSNATLTGPDFIARRDAVFAAMQGYDTQMRLAFLAHCTGFEIARVAPREPVREAVFGEVVRATFETAFNYGEQIKRADEKGRQ